MAEVHVGQAQSPIAVAPKTVIPGRFIKKTISYKSRINLSVHIEVLLQLFTSYCNMFYNFIN